MQSTHARSFRLKIPEGCSSLKDIKRNIVNLEVLGRVLPYIYIPHRYVQLGRLCFSSRSVLDSVKKLGSFGLE